MFKKVKLVKLDSDQISEAKKANGERKQITHAVVCGEYGQLFGTEKQCRKYYSAWSEIFPYLFSGGEEVNHFEFTTFETTTELVMVLIDAHDPLEKAASMEKIARMSQNQHHEPAKKKGLLAKMLRL